MADIQRSYLHEPQTIQTSQGPKPWWHYVLGFFAVLIVVPILLALFLAFIGLILGILLGGTIFGIYLATVVVPVIMSALATAGIPYLAALLIGILLGIAIVETTASFLGLIFSDTKRDISKLSMWEKIWAILALLAGIGLGIFLAVAIAPHIITALAGVGILHGLAVFTGIISGLAIISLTTAVLLQPIVIKHTFVKLMNYITAIYYYSGDNTYGGYSLSFFMLASILVGTSLGIYLSTLIFPLLLPALAALPALSYGLAMFATLAVCVSLISSCYSLFLYAGMIVGSFSGVIESKVLSPEQDFSPLTTATLELVKPTPVEPGAGFFENAPKIAHAGVETVHGESSTSVDYV